MDCSTAKCYSHDQDLYPCPQGYIPHALINWANSARLTDLWQCTLMVALCCDFIGISFCECHKVTSRSLSRSLTHSHYSDTKSANLLHMLHRMKENTLSIFGDWARIGISNIIILILTVLRLIHLKMCILNINNPKAVYPHVRPHLCQCARALIHWLDW